MKRYARVILAIVFLALLATPALMRRYGPRAAVASGGDPDGGMRYGFRLTESANQAGIDFVHQAPSLDAKLAHIMPQVASMGAAVSIADVDADGRPDLYVTNSAEGSKNRLYRNRGDGTFEDIAGQLGIADVNRRETGVSMGAVWATTTTMATKICCSTSGAAPNCFATTPAGRSHLSPAPACRRGRTSTRPSGSTSIATDNWTSFSAATIPNMSTSGISPTPR